MLHHGHRPSHTLNLTLQRLKGSFYVIHAPVRVVGDGIDVTRTTDRYGVVRFVVVTPDPPPPRLSLLIAGKPAGTVAVVYDSTNDKLWRWNGTNWKSVVFS